MAEVVDVAAAQHGGERAADVAHRQAELRRPCRDRSRPSTCGWSILRSVSTKKNMPLVVRFLQELLRDLVQRLERLGRADDELHRQADAPGSGGGWKATTWAPAMPRPACCCTICCSWLDVCVALVPRLQHHAGDRLAGHVDLEDVVGLRDGSSTMSKTCARVDLPLLDASHSAPTVAKRDDDALVLLRRELALGRRVEEIDAAQDDRRRRRAVTGR